MADESFNPYFHSAMEKLMDDSPHYVELTSEISTIKSSKNEHSTHEGETTTTTVTTSNTNTKLGKNDPTPYYYQDPSNTAPNPYNYDQANAHYDVSSSPNGLMNSLSNVVTSMTGHAYQPQVDLSITNPEKPFYLKGIEQIDIDTAKIERGDEFAAAEEYYQDKDTNFLKNLDRLPTGKGKFNNSFQLSMSFFEIWAISITFWFLISTAVYGYVGIIVNDQWTDLNAAMMVGSTAVFVLFTFTLLPPCFFYSYCRNTNDLSYRSEAERMLFFSCASIKTMQSEVWRTREDLEKRLVAIDTDLQPILSITLHHYDSDEIDNNNDQDSNTKIKRCGLTRQIPIDYSRCISPNPEDTLNQLSKTGSIVLVDFNVNLVLPQEQRGGIEYIKRMMVEEQGEDCMSRMYKFTYSLSFSRKGTKPTEPLPFYYLSKGKQPAEALLSPIEVNQLDHISQIAKRVLCFNPISATFLFLGCCFGPHYTFYRFNTSSELTQDITFVIQLGKMIPPPSAKAKVSK